MSPASPRIHCVVQYADSTIVIKKKLASILSKQLNRLLVTDKLETTVVTSYKGLG